MIPRIMSKLETDGTPMRLVAAVAFTVVKGNAKHFDNVQHHHTQPVRICFYITYGWTRAHAYSSLLYSLTFDL